MGAEGKEGAGRAGGRTPTGRGGAARGRPQSALGLLTPLLRDPWLLPAFPRLGAPLLAFLCHALNLPLHAGSYPTCPGPDHSFGAQAWAGPRAELPPSRLDSRRGAASRGTPRSRSARALGLPTHAPVRCGRGGAPSPAREPAPNSPGPRPRPALATAPALPGPGLSGSPREACFSNFSLSPSSRTSGALPLGPGPPRGASRHHEPAEFR